ncbi:MAG: hypothetical protein QOI83_620 [Streptomycetaceae bacterium]|nr:hypothetical protein [Streptomycetaceae bacterium]
MEQPSAEAEYASGISNSDAPWDLFDSRAYLDHNYQDLRQDDRQIIMAVRDYFCEHFRHRQPAEKLSGIDVGSGTNLYPSLSLLPWCSDITLYERSAGNVVWLEREIQHYSSNWDRFWQLFTDREPYRRVADPRGRLSGLATVEKGDLFDLRPGGWSIGTMFFVAESLSTARTEFEEALTKFIAALTPGAPFAAAFMENSEGYRVGDLEFPAYPVEEPQVRDCLAPRTDDLVITRLGFPGEPLRDGYTGMILACGVTS